MTEETKSLIAPEKAKAAPSIRFARLRRRWRRIYGPFGRVSARFLDYLAQTDLRRRRAALALAIAINLIVLTLLSTFARVRIWIPNAPSDTIQVTLVETLPFDLPLRDIDLQPEPEPEPEQIEPEPEPEPEPAPEPPATPEPEPEPEPHPEPEPELNLNIEPQFAPPADAPEPLIPDPAPAAEDAFTLPEPEEEPLAPVEEAEQPLITVEEEASQVAGLEEILGDNESEGEDESAAAEQVEEPDAEPELAEAPPEEPSGDDMFDEEPVFGRRSFIAPQIALPQVDLSGAPLPEGAAAILPGDSGVVAIFCPEQFTNEDKQEECAGRRQIRSGWRPGASGEDWSRATELLKRDRERGITGPTAGPVVETLRNRVDYGDVEALRDFRRGDSGVNNLPDAGDDNLNRGVEGNRPAIGPKDFEPSWTLRDRPEGVSQKDIEELERRIKEDQDEN